jgi:hypothetical protein
MPPSHPTISSIYSCAGRQNPDSVEAVRPVAHEDRKSKGRVPSLLEVLATVLENLSDSEPATCVFESGRNRERARTHLSHESFSSDGGFMGLTAATWVVMLSATRCSLGVPNRNYEEQKMNDGFRTLLCRFGSWHNRSAKIWIGKSTARVQGQLTERALHSGCLPNSKNTRMIFCNSFRASES